MIPDQRPRCVIPGCRRAARGLRPGARGPNPGDLVCGRSLHKVSDLPPELRRPVVLCSTGCGRKVTSRGLCQPHYNRLRLDTDPEYRRREREAQNRRRRTSPRAKLHNRAKMNARRARKAAAPGSCSSAQLAARWAMWGDRCWMCGAEADSTDHVIPLARGGSNWPANLRPACARCNSRKGAR